MFSQGTNRLTDLISVKEFRPPESLGDLAPMEIKPRKFVKEISSFKLTT